jgi:hypothetical protein
MKPLRYIDYQRVKWESVRRGDADEDEPGFEAVGRTLEPVGAAVSYGGRYRYPVRAQGRPLLRYGTAPPPLAGFWADLFSTYPQVVASPDQRAIMARWPATADTYKIADVVPFIDKLLAEAVSVLGKTAEVTARKSIGPWGPSDELLEKIDDIVDALAAIAKRLGKRGKFAKFEAAQKGFTAVTFPDLRKDAFAMMSLTYSLDRFVELEGGPSWIGSATLAIVDAFSRTGAWMIETGAKVAKPFLALLSNIDLLIWGGLGVLGVLWWRKRSKG